MSTRTATVSLLPERAAQFRTLLDDCLASLTHWIHSARSAASAPEPRVFSQLALALDRLVTVAARIEPAGAPSTNASFPGNAEPQLGTSPAPAQPSAPTPPPIAPPPSAPASSTQPPLPAPVLRHPPGITERLLGSSPVLRRVRVSRATGIEQSPEDWRRSVVPGVLGEIRRLKPPP